MMNDSTSSGTSSGTSSTSSSTGTKSDEPVTSTSWSPDLDAPGEHITVFADGSMGPAPREHGETGDDI